MYFISYCNLSIGPYSEHSQYEPIYSLMFSLCQGQSSKAKSVMPLSELKLHTLAKWLVSPLVWVIFKSVTSTLWQDNQQYLYMQ